jgi:hypothetical protein
VTQPAEFAANPIRLATLPDAFTPDGREAKSPELLRQLGIRGLGELVHTFSPTLLGSFVVPAYDHLRPSYTICAIVLALDGWRRSGSALPPLAISFYAHPVYDDAREVLSGLHGTA